MAILVLAVLSLRSYATMWLSPTVCSPLIGNEVDQLLSIKKRVTTRQKTFRILRHVQTPAFYVDNYLLKQSYCAKFYFIRIKGLC